MFVDFGYAPKTVARLADPSLDVEFLCCRILFFLTYETHVDFEQLLTEHHLDHKLRQVSPRMDRKHPGGCS